MAARRRPTAKWFTCPGCEASRKKEWALIPCIVCGQTYEEPRDAKAELKALVLDLRVEREAAHQ